MDMLLANWDSGWERQFKRFAFTPLAAASIGRVHRAQTLNGSDLAIKIQYPGVRESIDSDVDNVAALLRLSGLMPKAMDFEHLLRDAKRQLHDEANYIREGNYLHCHGDLLADAPQYRLLGGLSMVRALPHGPLESPCVTWRHDLPYYPHPLSFTRFPAKRRRAQVGAIAQWINILCSAKLTVCGL